MKSWSQNFLVEIEPLSASLIADDHAWYPQTLMTLMFQMISLPFEWNCSISISDEPSAGSPESCYQIRDVVARCGPLPVPFLFNIAYGQIRWNLYVPVLYRVPSLPFCPLRGWWNTSGCSMVTMPTSTDDLIRHHHDSVNCEDYV